MNLLCLLGRHKWEYESSPLPSLTLHRGCTRCGYCEYNWSGTHWTPWADGWTWEKAKDSLKLQKSGAKSP